MENTDNRRNGKLNLSIKVNDNRYPIDVYISDIDSFKLYFNPADPFVLDYAKKLRDLDEPNFKDEDEINIFNNTLRKNLDAIFGNDASHFIFRYIDLENELILLLMDKVREGYEDFKEKAAKQKEEKEKLAISEAENEANEFIGENIIQ